MQDIILRRMNENAFVVSSITIVKTSIVFDCLCYIDFRKYFPLF